MLPPVLLAPLLLLWVLRRRFGRRRGGEGDGGMCCVLKGGVGGPTPPVPIPVTILSGFLGAGKTTVLSHLIRFRGGLRLGLVVNDLSTDVNVDSRVLDAVAREGPPAGGGAGGSGGDGSYAVASGGGGRGGVSGVTIQLVDGCACCSGSEGLRAAVERLAALSPRLDCICVELSGVALPTEVRFGPAPWRGVPSSSPPSRLVSSHLTLLA